MLTSQVLNAAGMNLTIWTGGMAYAGIRLAGSWTGTITFMGSTDGLNFVPVTVTPFASGTGVQTATANGNWVFNVGNYLALRCYLTTLTTGTPAVYMAASQDAGYQDAFLTPATINSSQTATGINTLTQGAQANRAWNVSYIEVSLSGPAVWTGGGTIQILDGATVLWSQYLEQAVGSVGHNYTITLPEGGVTGTPGNAMSLVLQNAGGGVSSTINAKFSAK